MHTKKKKKCTKKTHFMVGLKPDKIKSDNIKGPGLEISNTNNIVRPASELSNISSIVELSFGNKERKKSNNKKFI